MVFCRDASAFFGAASPPSGSGSLATEVGAVAAIKNMACKHRLSLNPAFPIGMQHIKLMNFSYRNGWRSLIQGHGEPP